MELSFWWIWRSWWSWLIWWFCRIWWFWWLCLIWWFSWIWWFCLICWIWWFCWVLWFCWILWFCWKTWHRDLFGLFLFLNFFYDHPSWKIEKWKWESFMQGGWTEVLKLLKYFRWDFISFCPAFWQNYCFLLHFPCVLPLPLPSYLLYVLLWKPGHKWWQSRGQGQGLNLRASHMGNEEEGKKEGKTTN